VGVLNSFPPLRIGWLITAQPGVQFTVESTLDLTSPAKWHEALTTNVSTMPFPYLDRSAEGRQKWFRVRQP
jgi:hypothetical protein